MRDEPKEGAKETSHEERMVFLDKIRNREEFVSKNIQLSYDDAFNMFHYMGYFPHLMKNGLFLDFYCGSIVYAFKMGGRNALEREREFIGHLRRELGKEDESIVASYWK